MKLSDLQLKDLPFHQLMEVDASQLTDEQLSIITKKVQTETKNPGSRRAEKSKQEKILTGKATVVHQEIL